MVAFLNPDPYPQRKKRFVDVPKPVALLIITIFLSYSSSVGASEGARAVLRPYISVADTANSDALSGVTSTSQAVAQRVDYRDRYNAFDLSLLGAATGMCSPADDISACALRQANPCQAADQYGANTTLCQLPSFLGGSIPNSELCGHGATVDVTLTTNNNSSGDNSNSSAPNNTSLVAATLTAFRTRNSSLTLTITARSGWLIVPFTATTTTTTATATATATPTNSAARTSTANSEEMDTQQTSSPEGLTQAASPTPTPPSSSPPTKTTTLAPWVLMEGDLSYGDVSAYLTAPAREQQPLQQDVEGQWVAQSPPLERYSCYSVRLPLTGLTSACQALALELKLRLALVQVMVVAGSRAGGVDEMPDRTDRSLVEANCELGSFVWRAEANITLQPPWVAQQVQSAPQDTAAASYSVAAQQQAAARQQVFSDGVVAATAYSVTLDPRSSENVQWLAALAQQSPLLAAIPTLHSLVFLLGALRPELSQQLPGWSAAGSSSVPPLLPASTYPSTCDAASLSLVREAVLAVLESQGVTQARVVSLVCLQPPYSDVAASELPPCAQDTAMLYNMTLELPLEFTATTTSSISTRSTTITSRSSSSSAAKTNGGNTPSPQQLADMLVGAHFAAPWTCLSTEGQMRMATRLRLELQLPRAVGVEALGVADSSLLTAGGTSAPPPPAPLAGSNNPTPRPGTVAPKDSSANDASSASGRPVITNSSGGLRMTELAAVCVAAALAVFLVVSVLIVIRAVRQAKAAAAQAAAVTAAAATFARGSEGTVPYYSIKEATIMQQMQHKASLLRAEMSYDSNIEDSASILLAPDEHISEQVQRKAVEHNKATQLQTSGEHKAAGACVGGVGPCGEEITDHSRGACPPACQMTSSSDTPSLMTTGAADWSQQDKLATPILCPPPPFPGSHLFQTVAGQHTPKPSGASSRQRDDELSSNPVRNGARGPAAGVWIGLPPPSLQYDMSPPPPPLLLLSRDADPAAAVTLQLRHPSPPNDGAAHAGPNALGLSIPILVPPAASASLSCDEGDSVGDGASSDGTATLTQGSAAAPKQPLRPVSRSTGEDGVMAQGSGSSTRDLSGQQNEGAMGQMLSGESSVGGDGGLAAVDMGDVRSFFTSASSLSGGSGTAGRSGLTVLSRLRMVVASEPRSTTMWTNALYDEPQPTLHQQ